MSNASHPLYKVEHTDAGYRLVGPGVAFEARPDREYLAKCQDLAELLNHCRAVWETEHAQAYVEAT